MATNSNPNEYLQEDNKPFCSTESIFNKKNINKIITLFYVRNQILIGLAVNIILLILLILLCLVDDLSVFDREVTHTLQSVPCEGSCTAH